MKTHLLLLTLVPGLLHSFAMAQENPAAPVPLIFDTDIGNDCDDVLAMGVIHSLQSRGLCQLLAVTITKDHDQCAPFVDAINTFYGRGDIPIGVCRSGITPQQSRFTGLAIEKNGDAERYPHDLRSGKDASDAVKVLRQVLASQADGSVVIAQVGFSTNLANLLKSPADDISPLTGRELAIKKVKLVSAMAGAFAPVNGQPHPEYNVTEDVASAKALATEWPTAIVYSGFEIGLAIPYPASSILSDYQYVPHHPLKESYVLYEPPPHNRPTWDLTSVLYGVLPDRNYFGISPKGSVSVDDKGFTTFTPSENGLHRYLTLTPEQQIRATEALIQLSSEPPHHVPPFKQDSK
ncbi:MAG: nucleoside hydrolase [Planctomycetaceae bacterium]